MKTTYLLYKLILQNSTLQTNTTKFYSTNQYTNKIFKLSDREQQICIWLSYGNNYLPALAFCKIFPTSLPHFVRSTGVRPDDVLMARLALLSTRSLTAVTLLSAKDRLIKIIKSVNNSTNRAAGYVGHNKFFERFKAMLWHPKPV